MAKRLKGTLDKAVPEEIAHSIGQLYQIRHDFNSDIKHSVKVFKGTTATIFREGRYFWNIPRYESHRKVSVRVNSETGKVTFLREL